MLTSAFSRAPSGARASATRNGRVETLENILIRFPQVRPYLCGADESLDMSRHAAADVSPANQLVLESSHSSVRHVQHSRTFQTNAPDSVFDVSSAQIH